MVLQNMFRPNTQQGKDNPGLAATLDSVLDFRLDRVRRHLEFVARMFAEYISRRNLAVMYRLQQQVLILTIIATVLALLGIIGNWNQLLRILQMIWHR
jgi:hypothetical protein